MYRGKNTVYIEFGTIHWGSWNVFLMDKGGLLYHLILTLISYIINLYKIQMSQTPVFTEEETRA